MCPGLPLPRGSNLALQLKRTTTLALRARSSMVHPTQRPLQMPVRRCSGIPSEVRHSDSASPSVARDTDSPTRFGTQPNPSRSKLMRLHEVLATTVLLSLAFVACSSDDSGAKAGNNQACAVGATCNNDCKAEPGSCNMTCPSNAKCTATCNDGQSCAFTCESTAECKFNCAAGSCTVSSSSSSCSCTGNCVGTCGGSGVGGSGTGGSGGAGVGGSGSCEDACGSPTSPGYADCIAACAQ